MVFKKSITYCGNLISAIYRFYLKNALTYYIPLEMKLVIKNKTNKIKDYNKLKKYKNRYNFIYKFNRIEKKNSEFINLGYYYHTSHHNKQYFNNTQLAFPPDEIQSIKMILKNKKNKEYEHILVNDLMDKNNFINKILSHSTTDSKLNILLYFYLQKYLNIYDTISLVELEINDEYYNIDFNSKLNDIYRQISI